MSDKNPRKNDLRAWLRDGDPADDASLTPEETRRMRQSILAAAPDLRRPRLVPWAAFAGAVALAALLLLRPEPILRDDSTTVRPPVTEAPERTARQVQFTTDSGTRIVWTLDPDFEL